MENSPEPRVFLPYKSAVNRNALIVLIVLSPLWGLWFLYQAALLTMSIISGGIMNTLDLALLLAFYLGVFSLAVVAIIIARDNKLVLTADGLRVPLQHILEMAGERKRKWDEISSINFENDRLTLRFAPLGHACFELAGFSQKDLQDLCNSLKTNVPDADYRFDEQAKRRGIAGIKVKASKDGFTTAWEEDLASRFGTTAYIPMEAGQSLQDGRLTVIGQMTFGGLSAIYICRNKETANTVIVKEAVIPPNCAPESRAKALEMFAREARLLTALRHPNIARVLDHFVENEHNYLVLQHIEGVNLRQYIKENGPQSERIIMRWALEIAEILAYLHGLDPVIVHRDLTPDNLVLDKGGTLKLIDFGAANELIGTATGTLVGKQSYIAPEQFRGKAQAASDIYSLGCSLYFFATGSDPEALSQSTLPAIYDIEMPVLNALIRVCTHLDLEKRVATARSISDDARKYLGGSDLGRGMFEPR
ncbi:MAG: serine/threonine-protein kinase [Candidatus Obscuribacterales bacterium]|nr:serine/threonine-protein kinase [Candidatus Obscuribacterales bacterium]